MEGTKSLNVRLFLPEVGIGRQSANALPVNPGRQEQTGAWLTTRQSALEPHVPGQGSTHR